MRRFAKWGAGLVAGMAALFILGPYEPVEADVSFDSRKFGEGVQVYLESIEAGFADIRPDSQKRVVWAGQPETRTPLSVVYLHGFSASSQEIRPVPDDVARALGANLVFTRFRGHGRTGEAMAEGTATAWMKDAAEALAVGRATGERVIVIATSTGGTVAALALMQPTMAENVEGVVFVSPNFGINNTLAPLLTLPAARYWVPLFAGKRRSFEPRSADQGREWTTEYPSVAVFPMAALVKHAVAQDFGRIKVPALFYYSDDDRVVRPDVTEKVQKSWGGETTRIIPLLTENDDPFAHVVAGEIMSPDATPAATEAILDWIKGLR